MNYQTVELHVFTFNAHNSRAATQGVIN